MNIHKFGQILFDLSFSIGTMQAAFTPTPIAGSNYCHGRGSTALAWTTVASSAAISSRRTQQQHVMRPTLSVSANAQRSSSVALNALFIDDSSSYDRDAYSEPAVALMSMDSISTSTSSSTNFASWTPQSLVSSSISNIFLASSSLQSQEPDRAPTNGEVTQLQNAFASFYGAERNVPQAYESLTECIAIWEKTHQGGDEIAGLYRVRADVNMELFQQKDAEADYNFWKDQMGTRLIQRNYLLLGRARAVRSLGSAAKIGQATQASNDYETYFNSISQLDDEDGKSIDSGNTFSNGVIDGIQRNPYAAWEWGMVNRVAQKYDSAAEIHRLASAAFEEIGDKPRSVICALDRGIDLASGLEGDDKKQLAVARQTLEDAIESDVNVEGRDVELLQRVVNKEGEARLALSGVLWNAKEKGAAEAQYGTACSRLDDLNNDYNQREADRTKKGLMPPRKPMGATLGFSIDDIAGAQEASCSRFKNDKYIEEKLVWNEGLQSKVKKFLTLSR